MKPKIKNKVRKKIVVNPKIVFWGITVFCVILIVVSYKFSDTFSSVKNVIGSVVAPMQKGINDLGDYFEDTLDHFSDMDALIEENKKLREQIDDLKNTNQILNQEKYELSNYRELYELDGLYDQYKKVAAKVISKDPNSYSGEFIIDKGEDDGILKDMNVLAGNGLVGIVTQTGSNWARVRTIIDDSSKVSGMFLKTSDTCIVTGDLELIDKGYINVSQISLNAQIYDNYEVVTSYISDKYLPGILIGYVSDIGVDPTKLTQQCRLTPVVDFEHIDAVLIITQLREQYDGISEVFKSDN
ncbi:MAG: rod shape-determining protein MreC [Lachnospiraceae bacterium]|jgi:rod shape-determining protein MreC|nr:rod shape-determining protein MreC [Lachnospiraceae bacterium]